MGGHPYWYVVPYEKDVNAALQKLREREFKAGRYNPVTPFPESPVDLTRPSPGAQHTDYDDAFEDADADGTRSIVDMMGGITPKPWARGAPAHAMVSRVGDADLIQWFGTAKPPLDMVEDGEFWDDIERGCGIYIVIYDGDRPEHLFFAGYSFD